MNVDLDKYTRNFRIFYSKVVTGHPQQIELQKKFKFLLQNEATKWSSGLFGSENEGNSPVQSFLSRVKSIQPKSNKPKVKHDWLFETTSFSRAFVFACIASLLEVKGKQGILNIRQNLEANDIFIDGKKFSGQKLRTIIFLWSKVERLFSNSFNPKPMNILGDSLNDLEQEFVDCCFNILTKGKVESKDMSQIKEEKLKRISQIIKINIGYFQLDKNSIQNVLSIGEYKKAINIGKILEDNIIVVTKQIPSKMKQDVQKEKTLNKLTKISDDLIKMYENDSLKIFSLDAVISANSQNNSHNSRATTANSSNKSSRHKRSNSLKSQRY